MDFALNTYGSDQDGLVWGYLFTPQEPAHEIDANAAAAWLAKPDMQSPESFAWLHFSLSNSASVRWMRQHLALPDSFHEALAEPVSSTRLEHDARSLIAVIHDVLFDFTFDPEAVSTVNLCLQRRLLVSARLRPLRSVDRLRASVRGGKSFRSSAELIAHLLRDQADVLSDIARRSTVRVDDIEDRLLAHRVATSRRDLGAMRRTLVRLQRLLAPEPAALFRLLNRPPGWIGEDDTQDLRQAAEEFSAAVADSGALVERMKLLQEELAAQIGEQTNHTLFVLTVVTVLALPVNLIAGLFGMNVGGIPFTGNAHGFMLIVLPLIVLTIVLAYVAFGRRRE
jgi:zinc transporter